MGPNFLQNSPLTEHLPCLRHYVGLWLAALMANTSLAAHAETEKNSALPSQPMHIKYFSRGNTEGLWNYQLELVKLLLDKTTSEYGAYELSIVDSPLSAQRAKAETQKGEHINVHYSTEWHGEYVDINKVYQLEEPILKGLLGMRSLVIRADRVGDFAAVKQRSQLNQLVAAQRSDWPDNEILEFNQIKVVKAELFDTLSPMLQAGRFDYLPLSILEAEPTVAPFLVDENPLAISEHVAIYYPLTMHLYISKATPQIAARFKKGLEIVRNDQSMNTLFNLHFEVALQKLTQGELTTFILQNPTLTTEQNKAQIDQFLDMYGQQKNLVFIP